MHGDPVTIEGTELLARCVQHETDHLDGILFIDRLDKKQRKLAMKAIREAEWSGHARPRGQGLAALHPADLLGARPCGSSSQAPRRPRCPRCARSLASRHTVAAVVTRPDAPVGRGKRLQPSPVAELADELGLETLKPARPNERVVPRAAPRASRPTAAR